VEAGTYSFDRFTHQFGRTYVEGSEEYLKRVSVFKASLTRVKAINARNKKEGHPWVAGVQSFMDWTTEEKAALNGYKPAGSRHSRLATSAIELGSSEEALVNASSIEAVRKQGGMRREEGPLIRDQGNCGSCWAISAAEAVEAQLQRQGISAETQVAAQAFVDCVPNPEHCGGSGGCDGATGELAYAYARDHGIPLEYELPYTGRTGKCTPRAAASMVRVSSWHALPSNKAGPLMKALVEEGPVVVAVDGEAWFDYDNGVFDGCSKDAVLGHAVLAKGYGEDKGHKYWDIQNSWGSGWGENGHIRLLRHGGEEDDQWCGTDNKPKEGVGCDGGPAEVTVCGMCGLLYDPLVPTGVKLEQPAEGRRGQSPSNLLARKTMDWIKKQPEVQKVKTSDNDDEEMDALLDKLSR